MVDNSVFKIDGKNYSVIDTIASEDKKYVYFVNELDEKDFIINKEIEENEKKYLVNLDGHEEFEKAMKLFYDKNN